jgi:hypothetical protein
VWNVRVSPTADHYRNFVAKENQKLLTGFAVLQVNVAARLLANLPQNRLAEPCLKRSAGRRLVPASGIEPLTSGL